MQKLTPSDRTEILSLYNSGTKQADIARYFNVSQQTIYFILNPDKLEQNKQLLKETYDPEKNRERYKRYYAKKKKLINKK